MDPVQSLAILFAGAFLMVLVTAIFYVFTVRPRLLEPVSQETPVYDHLLRQELADQRTVIEDLNRSLIQQTQQLQIRTAQAPPSASFDVLRPVLVAQNEAVQGMNELLNQQARVLTGLSEQVGRHETLLNQTSQQVETLTAITLPNVFNQLTTQNAQLDRLENRLSTLPEAPQAPVNYSGLIQSQAERLLEISARLDAWAAEREAEHEKLAEQARILAELDRQLAAQAQVSQQIDAKVSEQTTMLLTQATERHEQATRLSELDRQLAAQAQMSQQIDTKVGEQANVLARIVDQLGEFFPILRQLIFSRPQTEPKSRTPVPGQDRLTDIKGIGPVYAGKLYEAGVYTFKQLAAMDPEEIRVLIDAPKWRQKAIDAEGWIEQARLFASQREKVEDLS